MKKAGKKSAMNTPSANSRVIEFPGINDTDQQEHEIEMRLRDLTALVGDLSESGYGVLLAEDKSTQEAFNELRVKVAALRWIIRVAKHVTGAVREKLWTDVEEALSGLEKTADLLLSSGFVWLHSIPAGHHSDVAGPVRF